MPQFRVRKINLEKVRKLFPDLVVCAPHRTIGVRNFYDGFEEPVQYTDESLAQFVGVKVNISGNKFHKALVAAGIVRGKT